MYRTLLYIIAMVVDLVALALLRWTGLLTHGILGGVALVLTVIYTVLSWNYLKKCSVIVKVLEIFARFFLVASIVSGIVNFYVIGFAPLFYIHGISSVLAVVLLIISGIKKIISKNR